MIYKIILGKNEIRISEEEKNFFVNNQDKKFVALRSGELVNVAFVQGIVIDHEAGRNEQLNAPKRKVEMIDGKPTLILDEVKALSDKFKM